MIGASDRGLKGHRVEVKERGISGNIKIECSEIKRVNFPV